MKDYADDPEIMRHQAMLDLRRAIERLRERDFDRALEEMMRACKSIDVAKRRPRPEIVR